MRKYISDVVTKDIIASWDRNELVAINAGTGTGKSYFVLNTLSEYAKENNQRILVLTNRVRLLEQYERQIGSSSDDTITLMMYQTLESQVEHKTYQGLYEYDYIVCDESHYFVTDSRFNHNTDISLSLIVQNNKSVRIMMSATNDVIKKYVTGYLKLEMKEYNIKTDYSYVTTHMYYDSTEVANNIIEDIMDDTYTGGKIIYFCQSAKRAYETHLIYKNNSLFHCSKHNRQYNKYVDKDKIKSLIKEEKFSERLLITTSALDNGINIIDRDVKHIIIDIDDIDTLIQCLGRKRIIDENDTITLYIRNMGNCIIGGKYSQGKQTKEMAKYLLENGVEKLVDNYSRKLDHSRMTYDVNISDGHTTKQVNMVKYIKLLIDIANWGQWLDQKKKGGKYCNPFLDEIGVRLGDVSIFWINMMVEEKLNKLDLYLSKIINTPLYSTEDINCFTDAKKKQVNPTHTKDDMIEMIGLTDSRGRILSSLGQLNQYLSDNNLDYILDRRKDDDGYNYYICQESDLADDDNEELCSYLDTLFGKKLYKDERDKLIKGIGLRDNRGKIKKSVSLLNEYLLELGYFIKNENKSVRIGGKVTKDSYWQIYVLSEGKMTEEQNQTTSNNQFFNDLGVDIDIVLNEISNEFIQKNINPSHIKNWLEEEKMVDDIKEMLDREELDFIELVKSNIDVFMD